MEPFPSYSLPLDSPVSDVSTNPDWELIQYPSSPQYDSSLFPHPDLFLYDIHPQYGVDMFPPSPVAMVPATPIAQPTPFSPTSPNFAHCAWFVTSPGDVSGINPPQRSSRQVKLPPQKGRKKYPCTWEGCEHVCAKKNAFEKHLRTHTKERPFPCDYDSCNKAFTVKCNLSRHQRTCKYKPPHVQHSSKLNQRQLSPAPQLESSKGSISMSSLLRSLPTGGRFTHH